MEHWQWRIFVRFMILVIGHVLYPNRKVEAGSQAQVEGDKLYGELARELERTR